MDRVNRQVALGARFYKTRSLAADAIGGGKVSINGDTVKPAKMVQIGDEVR